MKAARTTWVLTAAWLGCAATLHASEVSGSFVLDGKAVDVSEVSAFRIVDRSNPKQKQTFVMLTRQAPDREAIRQSVDPYSTAINDPAASGDYLSLFIDMSGEVGLNAHVGGTQYLDSSGEVFGQKGSLLAQCDTNTATRVSCSVKTGKPVSTSGGASWTLDVTFSADVLEREAGKPVEAGGGDAGKALIALQKALGGKDLAAITALLAADVAETYQADWRSAEENLADAKDTLNNQIPGRIKVTGGEYRSDDEALLDVEGFSKVFESKAVYSVTMVREEGRWLFRRSRLVGIQD